jgi:hypothetical protein
MTKESLNKTSGFLRSNDYGKIPDLRGGETINYPDMRG